MKTLLAVSLVIIANSLYGISNDLIQAITHVESRGNNREIGDNGKAFGSLQIHKGVIADVNRVYGTNYKHSDAFNRVKAKQIAVLYLKHYGEVFKRLYRKPVTNEIYARIWNAGINRIYSVKADCYWNRVKVNLNTNLQICSSSI